MNFDNLKNSFQSLSYHEADNTIDFTRKIQGIVEQVRKEDQKDKQRIIGVSILAAGFGLVYALMGMVKYLENKQGTDHWAFLIYVVAIICFVPILVREHRKKSRINYNVPLIEFIENVEKRFALFQAKDILIIPGFIVLGISMYFFIAKAGLSRLETILMAVAILVGAATVGFLVRLLVWRKKLMLRDELRRIKESLQ
jgi:hypothetical protein